MCCSCNRTAKAVFYKEGQVESQSQSKIHCGKVKDWKQKEKVTNAAKKLRPVGMKFLDDFSKRTLDKRFLQQTELQNAHKEGKSAYFAVNRLIIRDKPTGKYESQSTTDKEASFNIGL